MDSAEQQQGEHPYNELVDGLDDGCDEPFWGFKKFISKLSTLCLKKLAQQRRGSLKVETDFDFSQPVSRFHLCPILQVKVFAILPKNSNQESRSCLEASRPLPINNNAVA